MTGGFSVGGLDWLGELHVVGIHLLFSTWALEYFGYVVCIDMCGIR